MEVRETEVGAVEDSARAKDVRICNGQRCVWRHSPTFCHGILLPTWFRTYNMHTWRLACHHAAPTRTSDMRTVLIEDSGPSLLGFYIQKYSPLWCKTVQWKNIFPTVTPWHVNIKLVYFLGLTCIRIFGFRFCWSCWLEFHLKETISWIPAYNWGRISSNF